MNHISFAQVTNVYQTSASPDLTWHYIPHPTLRLFVEILNEFERKLNELKKEDYWHKFVKCLRRIRFDLYAAPTKTAKNIIQIDETLNDLRHHIQHIDQLYPQHETDVQKVLLSLEDLKTINKNYLLEKLVDVSTQSGSVAWVVKESRFIADTKDLVTNIGLQHVKVVHPKEMRGCNIYERVVIIGPPSWYSDYEYVFSAPRSLDTHVVMFDWIKDNWKPTNTFIQPHHSSGLANQIVLRKDNKSIRTVIDATDLLPNQDRMESVRSILGENQANEYDTDAICVFLENYWVIFVDVNKGAKTLVVDLDNEADEQVREIFVKEIEPGMFILARTNSGGDYVVPVADSILGENAVEARKCQHYWKNHLRTYIESHGLLETCIALYDHGSEKAEEQNVRNWMSPRSICTRGYEDFLAIMRLIGLESETQKYWTQMNLIRNAHRKAGSEIKNLLLQYVKELDADQFHKAGRVDIQLPGYNDASITAFRVESVHEEILKVPYTQIGQPIKL